MSEQPQTTATTAIELAPPPTAERATLLPTVSVIERLTTLANAVSKAGMFGIRRAEDAFARMALGWEHGIGAMAALAEIDVIDGKPALNARSQVAVIRQRKIGNIEVVHADQDGATVLVTRHDWPSATHPAATDQLTFTAEDAVVLGKLVKNRDGTIVAAKAGSNYAKHRVSMLIARAQSAAAHRWFQEVFLGLPYTPDELDADTDEAGRPITVGFEVVDGPTPQPMPPIVTPTEPTAPLPVEESEGVQALAAKLEDRNKLFAEVTPDVAAALAKKEDDVFAAGLQSIEQATLLNDRMTDVLRLKQLLRMGTPEYREWLYRNFGVESLKALSPDDVQRVVVALDRLYKLDRLRGEHKIPDAQWAKAMQKRGATSIFTLSAQEAQELVNKLTGDLDPFRRKQLGLDCGPSGPVDVAGAAAAGAAGVPGGNGHTPTPGGNQTPAPADAVRGAGPAPQVQPPSLIPPALSLQAQAA